MIDVLSPVAAETGRQRARIGVRGLVQGVGFRPFVYRLATELALGGRVRNSPQGAEIELEGPRSALDRFLRRLQTEKPPAARIQDIEVSFDPPLGQDASFVIGPTQEDGEKSALILPDLATCPECRREILDPRNRRFRYPFTNCTQCGPRFSLIEALPYDRAHTSMRAFRMCPRCAAEYHDPLDRRFHAQPNACPLCGPQIALWDASGAVAAQRDEALRQAAGHLREGRIVALKGIGGFQLLVAARNEAAVRRLRDRKNRPDKPFAVMHPSVAAVRRDAEVSAEEEELLRSAAAPIVLLRRQAKSALAAAVAPGNPWIGSMLPCSPLHHLLLAELEGGRRPPGGDFPVVATSGNRSEEPICTDEREALERLRGIADVFLVHDRPIVRPMDDSVVRVLLGRELVLRRARGYAPLPVRLPAPVPPIFAGGAHLKSCVALAAGRNVFLSQHLGDLSTPQARAAFQRAAEDLPRLYAVKPEIAACDAHPDYFSTWHVRSAYPGATAVQHHYAHALACMAEHGLSAPVLGVCWDGTGSGEDGTIWGGEFLLVDEISFARTAHFRPFPLPGGDAAAREPRRCALGALYAMAGDALFDRIGEPALAPFTVRELGGLRGALARHVNSPLTSSAGRLFDAAASLAGLRQRASFEGQAAMELEFAIDEAETAAYPFTLLTGSRVERVVPNALSDDAGRTSALGTTRSTVFDWEPTLLALRRDVREGLPSGRIAARFHRTLVDVIAQVAERAGVPDVALTGGCFQNAWLLTQAVARLRADGFTPHWPRSIPPNDGGIALGQVLAAARSRHAGVSPTAEPLNPKNHVPGNSR